MCRRYATPAISGVAERRGDSRREIDRGRGMRRVRGECPQILVRRSPRTRGPRRMWREYGTASVAPRRYVPYTLSTSDRDSRTACKDGPPMVDSPVKADVMRLVLDFMQMEEFAKDPFVI